MKKLIAALLLSAILLFPSAARADVYDDLGECVSKGKLSQYMINRGFWPNTTIPMIIFGNEENKAEHDNFPWRWDRHEIAILYHKDYGMVGAVVTRSEYQEFVSTDSRGIVAYAIYDFDLDGIPDNSHRNYIIVGSDNRLIFPDYPEGFRNMDWYKLSEEDAKRVLNDELLFWQGKCNQEEI